MGLFGFGKKPSTAPASTGTEIDTGGISPTPAIRSETTIPVPPPVVAQPSASETFSPNPITVSPDSTATPAGIFARRQEELAGALPSANLTPDHLVTTQDGSLITPPVGATGGVPSPHKEVDTGHQHQQLPSSEAPTMATPPVSDLSATAEVFAPETPPVQPPTADISAPESAAPQPAVQPAPETLAPTPTLADNPPVANGSEQPIMETSLPEEPTSTASTPIVDVNTATAPNLDVVDNNPPNNNILATQEDDGSTEGQTSPTIPEIPTPEPTAEISQKTEEITPAQETLVPLQPEAASTTPLPAPTSEIASPTASIPSESDTQAISTESPTNMPVQPLSNPLLEEPIIGGGKTIGETIPVPFKQPQPQKPAIPPNITPINPDVVIEPTPELPISSATETNNMPPNPSVVTPAHPAQEDIAA